MKIAKTLILTSSLAFVPMVWAQQAETASAAPAAKTWAGSYVGVTLGRSQGERRTVNSGSSSSLDTLNPGRTAYCWNVNGNTVVSGQLDETSCLTSGAQGSRIWYPTIAPFVESTATAQNASENSSSRQRNTVGLKAGHNWQKDGDRVVYGLEADYTQLRNQNNTISSSASSSVSGGPNLTTSTTLNGGVSWVSTARARIGYANEENTLLPYLTAGVAWGRIKTQGTASYSGNLQDSTHQFNDSSIKSGLVLGGGLDYRIDKNLVLNLSYMRTKLGVKRTLFTDGQSAVNGTSATSGTSSASIDPYVNLASIGLSYKFD